jgi:hypothetical protein
VRVELETASREIDAARGDVPLSLGEAAAVWDEGSSDSVSVSVSMRSDSVAESPSVLAGVWRPLGTRIDPTELDEGWGCISLRADCSVGSIVDATEAGAVGNSGVRCARSFR